MYVLHRPLFWKHLWCLYDTLPLDSTTFPSVPVLYSTVQYNQTKVSMYLVWLVVLGLV